MPSSTAGKKIASFFRRFILCGSSDQDTHSLQISSPTNFRREDITVEGLSEHEQSFIREKAISDATRLFATLQPLRSSPSATFTERPPPPTYEEFTATTPPPRTDSHTVSPLSTPRGASTLDRVRAHTRKISDSVRLSLMLPPRGIGAIALEEEEEGREFAGARAEWERPESRMGMRGEKERRVGGGVESFEWLVRGGFGGRESEESEEGKL